MTDLPPLHRWESVAHPRASVHIIHGMSEHGGRYARLAGELNTAGFIVWAHDHRGHGNNPTPPVGLGHFADVDGWRALVNDSWAVSAQLLATHPGLPIVLFAHSMGSFVGQTLMAERGTSYSGVVLSGTNGPPGAQEAVIRFVARVQRRVLGGRHPGTWLRTLVMENYNRRFAPTLTDFDWLSRDEHEVDKYAGDPLCGFTLTAQSWLDFLEGKATLGLEAHLQQIPKTLPINVIAGTRDPVGEESRGPKRLLDVYEKAGLTRVSHAFYEGARHELVNETNRDEVTRDLIGWLDAIVSA